MAISGAKRRTTKYQDEDNLKKMCIIGIPISTAEAEVASLCWHARTHETTFLKLSGFGEPMIVDNLKGLCKSHHLRLVFYMK